MKNIESLRDIISFNKGFRTAVNLYLNLNRSEKILGYIPTKSSIGFMTEYLDAVLDNKEQATLLVGPYGKGKSHLLLVLLAILSMEKNKKNDVVISELINKVRSVDEIGYAAAEKMEKIWSTKKFLPVLIADSSGNLNQAFLGGLYDALKKADLLDIAPETYYSVALDRLQDWESNYPDTFTVFEKELQNRGMSIHELTIQLKGCSFEALGIFKEIYPRVTAGSDFNPMTVSEVLPLYKNVSERLVEDYGYSGIYIVFDEFSKFIEGQDGTASGSNMKLLQDMCELATESKHAQIFITMVAHKSIKEYGRYLSNDIINSFTGIEGRIIEKYFVTSSKNNYELVKNAIIKDEKQLKQIPNYERILGESALKEYFQLPVFKSKFQKNDFDSIILKGCYPLNPLSAYLLLNISEKVAQNERTLFTFISNDEPNSMARFVEYHTSEQNWNIGADLIYDYFEALFKKEVSNEYVHNVWLSTEYVLDKCTSEDQQKIIKAMAIILIVNKEDEIPANDKYISLCTNTDDCAHAISELVNSQLIYKKSATGTFAFKTRAGSELKSEIKKQRELKGDNVNYSKALTEVTGKYYVVPRRYNTIYQMTRFFNNEYMSVDDFLNINSAQAILNDASGDGKVITLYSFTGIKQEQVNRHLEELADSRIVVVCPKRGIKIKKELLDFELIQELRNNQVFTNNNEILKKELPLLLDDLTSVLENALSNIYELETDTRVLYFDGKKIKNVKAGNEEKAVNDCCELVYFKTPVINNEIVNRSVINTAQTKKARINIIQEILNHTDNEEFYAGSNQEATVYRSLFCQTGIVSEVPKKEIAEIIHVINMFIDECSEKKGSLKELCNKLSNPPYGIRLGVLPIYLAYVLANRREDIIVYFSEKEIQISAEIIVNMCDQPEDYDLYVSKEDLQKEKYISALNLLFDVKDNRNLSTNRIKNIFICMQRWFRALPQVSRNMVCIEQYINNDNTSSFMKRMKTALQQLDYNPFEILFIEFPQEIGTNSLEETYKAIDECKTFFDDYYDWIQAEISEKTYEIWGGKKKQDLYHTLLEWYDKQSKRSKQGLYNGRMTNLMSSIETMNVYSDSEVAMKIVKAVTDVYLENWNVGALDEFVESLQNLKKEIEAIKDEGSSGELTLKFTDRHGNEVTKLYSHAAEGTGTILRNIIEDTLDEYSDLSVNDRVSILLEMIEKVIK